MEKQTEPGDLADKFNFLIRVNTRTMKRKCLQFIRRIEEVIEKENNWTNNIKEHLDIISKGKDNTCQQKKTGIVISALSTLGSLASYALIPFTGGASAALPVVVPIVAMGVGGAVTTVVGCNKEKKLLGDHLLPIEIDMDNASHLLDEMRRLAEIYFQDIDEYLVLVESYIVFTSNSDLNQNDYMDKLKKHFGLEFYDWIKSAGEFICLWKPIMLEFAGKSMLLNVSLNRPMFRAATTLSDDVSLNPLGQGTNLEAMIFYSIAIVSLISSIDDYYRAGRTQKEIGNMVKNLREDTEKIDKHLCALRKFSDELKKYEKIIEDFFGVRSPVG